MPVSIHMSLAKWDRFSQNVEASSHKVDVKYLMVSNHTEDSFIEVTSLRRHESDDNSSEREGLYGSLSLGE